MTRAKVGRTDRAVAFKISVEFDGAHAATVGFSRGSTGRRLLLLFLSWRTYSKLSEQAKAFQTLNRFEKIVNP